MQKLPKTTFFNLPEEKRNRITEAAIDEFVKYTYQNASITRIVDNSDIAKGSFYQYFEDKKDLYKYIIDISVKLKMEYLTVKAGELDRMDFFNAVRALCVAGLEFAKCNPKVSIIGDNLMKDSDIKFRDEILGEGMQKSNSFLEGLLIKGIQRGDVVPDIDVKLAAFLITSLNMSMGEYYLKEYKEASDIMALIDKMLYVVKNGILRKKGDDRNVES